MMRICACMIKILPTQLKSLIDYQKIINIITAWLYRIVVNIIE